MKLLQFLLLGLSACVIAAYYGESTVSVSSVSLESSELSTNLDISTESTISHLTKKSPTEIGNTEYKRVCYYLNQAQHRPGKCACLPEDLDAKLCTHWVYAYATIDNKSNTVIPTDPTDDIPNGGYERFNNLKKNSNVKTLLAVGGFQFILAELSNILKTNTSRFEFIEKLILYLRKHNFNGVCLDFFYPGSVGSPTENKARFTYLCKDMREAFDEEAKGTGNETLLMVVTFSGNKEIIDNGIELHNISECVDFINLVAFKLHNLSDIVTAHHSPLYPSQGSNPMDAHRNMEWSAEYCEELGVPKNKIIIGMALYGRGFTLKNSSDHGIGAPIVGHSPAPECSQYPGVLCYFEICSLLSESTATKVWLTDEKVPYVYNDTFWMGYDDQQSLETKVNWLKWKGYGGYSAWTADTDDCKGLYCNQGPYPLLTTLYKTLMGSVTGSLPPLTKILESSTKSLTEITETKTTGYEMSTLSGPTCEGRPDGFYPYPVNCTMYIQCVNHIAYDKACPEGLYWNISNCTDFSDLTDERKKNCYLH